MILDDACSAKNHPKNHPKHPDAIVEHHKSQEFHHMNETSTVKFGAVDWLWFAALTHHGMIF